MTPQEIEKNHLSQNLGYLLMLRIIAMTTQLLALAFMYFNLELPIPMPSVMLLIAVLFIYTIICWKKQKKNAHISARDFMKQLIIDIVALSLLIYFTGGSTNPFIFFFLLPITFAAATLKFKQTCIIATLAAISYTTLMFFHVPLLDHSGHHDGFDLHVWGMWYGFLISAALLAYYVSRVGATVRERNKALAITREENLRADQVLALGTLAAGTAHELGTPLATMAVLAKELEYDHEGEAETLANLKVLRQQIGRCKTILSKMAVDAGTAHAESGATIGIHEYLYKLVDDWYSLRPDANLSFNIDKRSPELEIIADETLTQSIKNVLNNAADAAEVKISLQASWSLENLEILITDDGQGIDEHRLQEIGKSIVSDEQTEGMGIGLFLAQITLNRLGGQLRLSKDEIKGTNVLIQVPLSGLKTRS